MTALETFFGVRESLLPGPSQSSGYRTVLIIGPTGAGKTTLAQQLIGSDPAQEHFLSTSAAKTTIAETELLCAPGDYYSVVTFLSRHEVRSAVEECVEAAAMAIYEKRPTEEIRRRLLQHSNQRFRLNYIIGEGLVDHVDVIDTPTQPTCELCRQPAIGEWVDDGGGTSVRRRCAEHRTDGLPPRHLRWEPNADGTASTEDTEPDPTDTIRETTEALLVWTIDVLTALVDHVSHQLHHDLSDYDREVALGERIGIHAHTQQIVDRLMLEIELRFLILDQWALTRGQDGWPLYWRTQSAERPGLIADVSRFTSNSAQQFGMLLTPLVSGIRVRAPFHPDWMPEIPFLMLIDGEGLGHTPESATSLPGSLTRMFDLVDTILLVDNAQQPMQATAAASLHQVAAAGHADKLAVCFTHFEMVKGRNLRTYNDRRDHVLASLEQSINAFADEYGRAAGRALRDRLDQATFFAAGVDEQLKASTSARTIEELRNLLDTLRSDTSSPGLCADRPGYSRDRLFGAINEGVRAFHDDWRRKLLGHDAESGVQRSKVRGLTSRYARRADDEHDSLRPIGDLHRHITERVRSVIEEPVRWSGDEPKADDRQRLFDFFARETNSAIRHVVRDRLLDSAEHLWTEAYEIAGDNAADDRATFILESIFDRRVARSASLSEPSEFVSELMAVIDKIAVTIDIAIEDPALTG